MADFVGVTALLLDNFDGVNEVCEFDLMAVLASGILPAALIDSMKLYCCIEGLLMVLLFEIADDDDIRWLWLRDEYDYS